MLFIKQTSRNKKKISKYRFKSLSNKKIVDKASLQVRFQDFFILFLLPIKLPWHVEVHRRAMSNFSAFLETEASQQTENATEERTVKSVAQINFSGTFSIF